MSCQETFYLKKAQDMPRDEKISLVENEERLCKVCMLQDDCPGGVMAYPGGSPNFPHCADSNFEQRYIDDEILNEVVADILHDMGGA